MSRGFLLSSIICLAYIIPSVVGSAVLVPRLSTASCTGHFENLSVTSITCDGSNEGCTYGSQVFVTGQVQTDADLPRPMMVKVSKTFPSFYAMGTNVYNADIYDLCDGAVASPYDDDAGYVCPSAGLYNFHFEYQNFGDRKKWYSGWHGFNMGMLIHFKHEGGGSDYATCSIDVKVKGSEDDSYVTNASMVSVAMLGLAGLLTGLFVRRRKERLATSQENIDEVRKELSTNFELVQDAASAFV